jgi:hypothetical protein
MINKYTQNKNSFFSKFHTLNIAKPVYPKFVNTIILRVNLIDPSRESILHELTKNNFFFIS